MFYMCFSVEFMNLSVIATSFIVTHIEVDKYIPGNLLVSSANHLVTINQLGEATLVAGKQGVAGFVKGESRKARFRNISSFTQFKYNKIAVVDRESFCLLLVERMTGRLSQVKSFIPNVSVPHKNHKDAHLSYALFFDPVGILQGTGEDRHLLYVSETTYVRQINMKNELVITVAEDKDLTASGGMAWATTHLPSGQNGIFICNKTNILKLSPNPVFENLNDGKIKAVVGQRTKENVDKSFINLPLASVAGIAHVIDDIFAIADNKGRHVHIVDMQKQKKARISLNDHPVSVHYSQGKLYVYVDPKGINVIQGK